MVSSHSLVCIAALPVLFVLIYDPDEITASNFLVQSPPIIEIQPPKDILLFQVAKRVDESNKPFVIECNASGNPEPTYRWIKNGIEFKTDDRIIQEPGQGTLVGTIPRDKDEVYQMLPAEIIEPPNDDVAIEGHTAKMLCRVSGAPKPEVRWIRNAQELTGRGYKVLDNGDLEIRSVSFSDSGVYTCFASNIFGDDTKSGSLVVKAPTVIHSGPENYQVAAGNPVTFRCTAGGDSSLALTIDWYNEGGIIDYESEPRYVKLQDNSLTIDKTTELDSGTYTCFAHTKYDNASAEATLIVQDVPNRPELISIDCRSRDATLSWKAMGDNRAPILHYTIQFNTSFTPDSWEVASKDVPATESSYTVSMSPWANYTFRVIARNSIGPSLPSLHSESCSTPGPVENVQVRALGTSALYLIWEKPEHPNRILIGYRIKYARVDGTQLMESEMRQRVPDINHPEITRAKLAGLQPNTVYRVFVAALTRVGPGIDFIVEERTYAETFKPSKPSFLWDHADSTNGLFAIRINWRPSLDADDRPGSHFFTQYKKKWFRLITYVSVAVNMGTRKSGRTTYTSSETVLNEDYEIVHGLEPRLTYLFRVVSVEGNQTTASDEQEVYTYSTEHRPACDAIDKFGTVWIGRAGQTVFKVCGFDANGTETWTCMENGKFAGNQPLYDRCSSKWLQRIESEIDHVSIIDLKMADKLLQRVELKTTITSNNHAYYGNEIKRVLALGTNILSKLPNDTELQVFKDLTNRTVEIIACVVRNDIPWSDLNKTQRSEAASEIILSLEDAAQELTAKVPLEKAYNATFSQPQEFYLLTGITSISNNSNFAIVFPFNSTLSESHLRIPSSWAVNIDRESRVNYAGIRLNADLANKIFPADPGNSEDSNTVIINGDILSFSFGTTPSSQLDKFLNFSETEGVKITFEHILPASNSTRSDNLRWNTGICGKPKAVIKSATCVYWDIRHSKWSRDGCKLIQTSKTISTCECNHLTAFALLMDVHKHSNQNSGLEILTWIILPISCLALLISIAVLWKVNQTRSLRNLITINLCGCLLLGKLMLLISVDRNYLCLNDITCKVTGTITHYVFLCAFSWMSMEGGFLYQRIIVVFAGGRTYTRLRHITAYSVPAIIVAITWLIAVLTSGSAYGNDEFCWLTDQYIWAFMGPVSGVIVVNMYYFTMTFRIAYNAVHKSKLQGRHQETKNCLSWMKGSFSLTVLLGITWILGYFLLMEDPWFGTIAAYAFTLLNASQGIFLFVFNIIMDKGIRSKLAARFPTWFTKSISYEVTSRPVNAESRH